MAYGRDMRSTLLAAYDAAVDAGDPESAVARAIVLDDAGITIGGHRFAGARPDDVVVVALGKAAPAMSRGVARALGTVRGVAVSNHREACPVPLTIGSHPVPDEASLRCGELLLEFIGELSSTDLVVYLVSGGGSAIAVAPAEGVGLGDLARLNDVLLSSAVPIGDMNEVRAAVSRLKGGGLASASRASRSVTLVLSDVVGVGPVHVASGPTLGAGMGARAAGVLERYRLESQVPTAIRAAVERWRPPVGVDEGASVVVGSSEVAAAAAAAFLHRAGIDVSVATTALMGEARIRAVDLIGECASGAAVVATGETTVTVVGPGVGGRNQEAALAAAIEIDGSSVVFSSLGTDGIDGATPAAGAIVDGRTAADARARGVDLRRALERNDSHPVLSALGATVVRGDTGTNVGDLWMVARDL